MYSIASRTALRRAALAPVSRTAMVSMRYSSTMHDNDPDVLESEKRKNLSGKQHSHHKSAPGWNENLASASEAAVKVRDTHYPVPYGLLTQIHRLTAGVLAHPKNCKRRQ